MSCRVHELCSYGQVSARYWYNSDTNPLHFDTKINHTGQNYNVECQTKFINVQCKACLKTVKSENIYLEKTKDNV